MNTHGPDEYRKRSAGGGDFTESRCADTFRSPSAGVLLRAEELSTGYPGPRGRVVSRNVGLELERGELVSLVGPNGTGKSTLLKTLGGLVAPLSGEVLLEGKRLHLFGAADRAREIAVVLAGRVEAGHLSVRKLVSLGRYPYTGRFGMLKRRDEETVSWALDSVGGMELAGRYVDELSDGEYQRIMIARALAQQPRIVLLDEPAAFLDLMKRVEIMHLLRKISRNTAASFVAASHDLDMVMAVSDRVWLLDEQGNIHEGAPEDHVIDGTLERVFHSSHVEFDKKVGTFRHISDAGRPRVVLSVKNEALRVSSNESSGTAGESRDDAGEWTRRALERIGFRVVNGGNGNESEAPTGIRVELQRRNGEDNGLRWKVRGEKDQRTHGSISSLARDLRGRLEA